MNGQGRAGLRAPGVLGLSVTGPALGAVSESTRRGQAGARGSHRCVYECGNVCENVISVWEYMFMSVFENGRFYVQECVRIFEHM